MCVQNEEDELFKRDFGQATLEDHFDKTVLPKVMQVKDFGRAGRTKYTHLVDQDTTEVSPRAWVEINTAYTNQGSKLLPYSRKYWRALNLAVEPKIAIERILADLNLAVRYGIAIRIYASKRFWWIFNLAVVIIDR